MLLTSGTKDKGNRFDDGIRMKQRLWTAKTIFSMLLTWRTYEIENFTTGCTEKFRKTDAFQNDFSKLRSPPTLNKLK